MPCTGFRAAAAKSRLPIGDEAIQKPHHADSRLQDADVICTTTISSGGDFFSKFAFAGVLIDEVGS